MVEIFRFKLAGSQKLAENGTPRLSNMGTLVVGDGIFVQLPANPGPLLVFSDQGLEIGEVREPNNSKIIHYLNSGYAQSGYSTQIESLPSGKKSVEIKLTLLSIEEKKKSERLKRFDFVVLDVETANQSYASICQIGLAFVRAGEVIETWGTYVDPEERFTNTRIHGIDARTVNGSPTFPSAWSQAFNLIDGFLVFHHTNFDHAAITQAMDKYDIQKPKLRLLDSSNIARTANPKFAVRGYGLENLCKTYQIPCENHHDAIADASMTAKVICCLLSESRTSLKDWSHLETNFQTQRSRNRVHRTDFTFDPDQAQNSNSQYSGVLASLNVDRPKTSFSLYWFKTRLWIFLVLGFIMFFLGISLDNGGIGLLGFVIFAVGIILFLLKATNFI